MTKFGFVLSLTHQGHGYSQLRGTRHDALVMKNLLVTKFGFLEENVKLYIDYSPLSSWATAENIKDELKRMASKAKDGDVIYFFFSGHGSRKITMEPEFNVVNYILAADGNIITDKDLRQINDMVPFGCNFTMMIDSCNSGGMLNGAIEQHCDFSVTNKLVKDLKGATENGKALGTLISACQGFEYAVDAGAVCRESRRCHSPLIITLLRIFRKKGYSFTNGELVAELRKLMHTSPFSQRPGLFCTDFQAQSTFFGACSRCKIKKDT